MSGGGLLFWAVIAGLGLEACAVHGFASHGWGPRLAAWITCRPAPAPTAHHARHEARLARRRFSRRTAR
jgi:hypothetical protein